jgi:hypothetical protein
MCDFRTISRYTLQSARSNKIKESYFGNAFPFKEKKGKDFHYYQC